MAASVEALTSSQRSRSARVLELLRGELELAMMLAGVDDARRVDPTLLVRS